MLDPVYRAGEPLSAKQLNERRDRIERLGNLRGGGLIGARESAGGGSLAISEPARFFLKLTSVASGTKYAWKEVVPATGGLWVDTGITGSVAADPAYEVNAHADLTVDGAVYEALRAATTGEVLFRVSLCLPNSGWISLPGCNCNPTPPTIYLDSIDPGCNAPLSGIFQDATIEWSAVPASLEDLALGDYAYLSTTTFVSDYSSDAFYYLLTCGGSYFSLSRVFPTSVFGSPFREPPIYSWLIGDTGNTCDPFLMSNGFVSEGTDPDCDVDLSE